MLSLVLIDSRFPSPAVSEFALIHAEQKQGYASGTQRQRSETIAWIVLCGAVLLLPASAQSGVHWDLSWDLKHRCYCRSGRRIHMNLNLWSEFIVHFYLPYLLMVFPCASGALAKEDSMRDQWLHTQLPCWYLDWKVCLFCYLPN